MDPTIYYSEHSCFLSGLHQAPYTLLPNLAISRVSHAQKRTPPLRSKNPNRPKTKSTPSSHLTLEFDHPRFNTLIESLAIKLPSKIQHRIFTFLILSWDPDRPFPVRAPNGFNISLARRYLGTDGNRAIRDLEIEEMRWPEGDEERHFDLGDLGEGSVGTVGGRRYGFRRWREVSIGGRKGGLDYFKKSEVLLVQRFLKALEKWEGIGWEVGCGGGLIPVFNDDEGFKRRRGLGVLKGFMEWFWDEIVVDLRGTEFRGRSFMGGDVLKPLKMCPKSHHAHHAQISHISLNLTLDDIPTTKTLSKNNQQFVHLCRAVSTSCLGLQSIVLFLAVPYKEIDILMANPLKHKSWIRAIRKMQLSARGSFEVKLLLLGDGQDLGLGSKTGAGKVREGREKRLCDLLQPVSMLDDEEYGIRKMFEGIEGYAATSVTSRIVVKKTKGHFKDIETVVPKKRKSDAIDDEN